MNENGILCSLPDVSNETALFSAAWYLDGVRTGETYLICKVFASLVDILLKHDPDVLLVQEGHKKETKLHLYARLEEDSDAHFFGYLTHTNTWKIAQFRYIKIQL